MGNDLESTDEAPDAADGLTIRAAAEVDISAVSDLDAQITGLAKPDYWADMFKRYGKSPKRSFLIASDGREKVIGLIIGEVRAWEFGSPPCGWVFALSVDPDQRLKKVGTRLYKALCLRLAASGVDTVRTMLARDDALNMAFFRSQGMMAGPFIELEMALDDVLGDER